MQGLPRLWAGVVFAEEARSASISLGDRPVPQGESGTVSREIVAPPARDFYLAAVPGNQDSQVSDIGCPEQHSEIDSARRPSPEVASVACLPRCASTSPELAAWVTPAGYNSASREDQRGADRAPSLPQLVEAGLSIASSRDPSVGTPSLPTGRRG